MEGQRDREEMVGRKEGGPYICTYINGQQGLTVAKRSVIPHSRPST